jgi:zinc transport system ATP-binding protein
LNMTRLLEIRSLSVSYGSDMVLEDVNLNVGEGDFIGIIGPNGGGKTTLLKVILGLLQPDRGKIEYGEILSDSNRIGYLPQMSTGDINYPVTVKDIILSGLMIKKKAFTRMAASEKEKADKVMGEMGLKNMADLSLSELSGGELQRVMLGRAIIGDPGLLLLDEPDNFVDTSFQEDFYEKLKELNNRMAILMVSHDIGTISTHIKSFACVNRFLHYHPSSEITQEDLQTYGCPIQLITHGLVPHTVLKHHK